MCRRSAALTSAGVSAATFAWDADLEAKIAALTPEQVNAAFRRYIDPAKVSFVAAGDFKK